jgi:hypothetical protein
LGYWAGPRNAPWYEASQSFLFETSREDPHGLRPLESISWGVNGIKKLCLVIPTTQEAKVRRFLIKASPDKKVSKTPFQQTIQKKETTLVIMVYICNPSYARRIIA